MTRKDFEAIAAALRMARQEAGTIGTAENKAGGTDALDVAALHLAAHLATTNPRFDRARFLDACIPPRTLRCEMNFTCAEPVTHIDEKGFTYCAAHGVNRRNVCRCRKLTATETRTLQRNGAIAY
jgi:hypothetical protein